jgi:hypothetical protein
MAAGPLVAQPEDYRSFTLVTSSPVSACARHAAFANSPAISRFTRCTVPLPTPTNAATLRMPFPALRCLLMAPSVFGDTFGRPSFFPCWRTRSRPARTLSRMIDLSCSPEHGRHLDHGSPHRRGTVDGLLVGIERHASSVEFRQGIGHVENTARQSVDGPHHQDVELSPHRVFEHLVKGRALIPAFRATDPLILVGLDNQPATVLRRR